MEDMFPTPEEKYYIKISGKPVPTYLMSEIYGIGSEVPGYDRGKVPGLKCLVPGLKCLVLRAFECLPEISDLECLVPWEN